MDIHRAIMQLLTAALVTASMASWTNPVHNEIQQLIHDHLEQQLKSYTQQLGAGRYEISISQIDPRLRLRPCSGQLVIQSSQHRANLTGRTTHKVKCQQSPYWSLYVAAHVKLYRQVIAANRTLQKGQRITVNDLVKLEKDIAQLRGSYYTEASKVLGKVMTRQVTMGRPITHNHITQATAIKKGTQVAIQAHTSAFSVLAKGIALSDGKPGQLIKVRNIRSKRVIQAVVRDAFTVEAML